MRWVDDDVWLEKATENLASAQSELINGRFNSCANRCYYACFHAAIGALVRADVRPRGGANQWSHDFVQAQFAGELVNRRKLYPPELRSTLAQNYALRRTADYTTDTVTATRAVRAVARSESFVYAVRERWSR